MRTISDFISFCKLLSAVWLLHLISFTLGKGNVQDLTRMSAFCTERSVINVSVCRQKLSSYSVLVF